MNHHRLLKTTFFVLCFVFAAATHANHSYTNDKIDQPQEEDYYFIDADNLELLHDSDYVVTFKEKKDPNVKWIFFPLHSWMRDFEKVVASVVISEFHRRIDEHALVPITKFLVNKDTGNKGYHLWGSIYKKISSTSLFREEMHKRGFEDPTNKDIYGDNKIEHIVGMWKYLGLSSPDYYDLEVSKDNKLIRYDYYDASGSYSSSQKFYKHCFCTSDFAISDYNCDIEYMKVFQQALRAQHEGALKKIISEINKELEKYPKGEYLQVLDWYLDRVAINRETKLPTEFNPDDKPEKEL